MKRSFFLLWIVFFSCNHQGFCQPEQIYQVNESTVLQNKNLDFFLSKLRVEHFTTLKSKKDIPDFIKKQLPRISEKNIADRNEAFQSDDEVTDTSLPWRHLIFLCKSEDMLVVTYEMGGVGVSYIILLVKYANKKVIDVWVGQTFCSNLISKAEVIKCITENRGKEDGLNTNVLHW